MYRRAQVHMPNHPTKNLPAKIGCLKISVRFPMGLGFPPLKIKILLGSNPLKSRILAQRLAAASSKAVGDLEVGRSPSNWCDTK